SLDAHEAHHLKDVLRLAAGDQVTVFDGEGREFVCVIEKSSRNSAELKILREESRPVESRTNIVLCQALVKGEKFDLIVQKATELGVSRIIPTLTAHAHVKPSQESSNRRLERWRRITLEATKQSGRTRLVDIQQPVLFAAALETEADTKYLFAERGGALLRNKGLDSQQTVALFIGPEGGWQNEEIELARANGCEIITIGPRILRTETAAITAVALLQYLYGDLSQPVSDEQS